MNDRTRTIRNLGDPIALTKTLVRVCGWASLWVISALAIGCKEPSSAEAVVVPMVHVAPVKPADGSRKLRLSGTIEAERSVVLSFPIVGTVEQVFVEEGQFIKRGQVVARISARSYQDALGIAKAKANQAEDAYRRLKPMADNKTLPEIKLVEIESGLEQARLTVSMAAKNVQDSVLRAPESGTVAKRSLEPGASVAPGVPVITLVQNRTVLAAAPVPETQIAQVKKGDPARVTVSALNQTFEGIVREIGVVADPLTRTYTVKVALDNRDGVLRVGMVSDVELIQQKQQSVVVVPPQALHIDEAGVNYVFVVQDKRLLHQRKVEVVGYVGEGAAIARGVSENELVVTSGTPMLSDGMSVIVAESKPEAG